MKPGPGPIDLTRVRTQRGQASAERARRATGERYRSYLESGSWRALEMAYNYQRTSEGIIMRGALNTSIVTCHIAYTTPIPTQLRPLYWWLPPCPDDFALIPHRSHRPILYGVFEFVHYNPSNPVIDDIGLRFVLQDPMRVGDPDDLVAINLNTSSVWEMPRQRGESSLRPGAAIELIYGYPELWRSWTDAETERAEQRRRDYEAALQHADAIRSKNGQPLW